MSDAAAPPRTRHPNPASLMRALAALELEAQAAARLGMSVADYRALFDSAPR